MDKHDGPAAVGGSSLLVIFATLCLVVFALLGLSTVQAEGRLSTASKEAVTAYYAADSEAEAILARLRAGELPEGVVQDGSHFTYQCPISETQALAVTVALTENTYEVLQWQVIPTTDWESDNGPAVWDGSTGT